MATVQNILGSLSGVAWLVVIAAAVVLVILARRFGGRGKPESSLGRDFRAADPESLIPGELPVEREDPDLVERVAISRHIADLMLADEWGEIGAQVAEWENQLVSAPGGARYHDIAAYTALSGLQHLIDEAPHAALSDLDRAEEEVAHFVDTFQRNTDSHVLAAFAARAHLALGEACRADHWPEELQREAWRRMARHFLEAGEILANYDPLAYMSPLLAEAHYAQALGTPGGTHRLDELFNAWIDLDPSNPLIYERHAELLADVTRYDDAAIQAEADKALDRTVDTLGFGGYALFYLPLLDIREGARELLDAELFASAMLDLASMEASQAEVNQTANALAVESRMLGDAQALSDTLYLLIRGHMEVIYPRLWTLPEERVQSLVRDAAMAIPDIFPKEPANSADTVMSKAA